MSPTPTKSAYREAKPHVENFFNKFLRMPPEMLLPPGYLSLASMKGVMMAKGAMTGGEKTIDDLMKVGMFMCGRVDTIVQKFEEYQKQIGFGYLLTAYAIRHAAARSHQEEHEDFRREGDPAPAALSRGIVAALQGGLGRALAKING